MRQPAQKAASGKTYSSAVPNGHDVAVFDGIFLTFEAKQSLLLQCLHRPVLYEVIVMTYFAPYEMVGQIGVNDARRILCIHALRDRPRPAFLFSNSKERDQPKQSVSRANETFRS